MMLLPQIIFVLFVRLENLSHFVKDTVPSSLLKEQVYESLLNSRQKIKNPTQQLFKTCSLVDSKCSLYIFCFSIIQNN